MLFLELLKFTKMDHTTQVLITFILALGMLLALMAIGCAKVTFENPKDRNLLGIPFGIIGFLGYLVMLIAICTNLQVFYPLVFFAAAVTPIFIWKSIKLRKFCPFCAACWATNIVLAVFAIKSLL